MPTTVFELVLPVTPGTLGTAAAMVLGYLAALFVGSLLLPGLDRPGYELPNGERKRYHLAGMSLWYWLHVAVGVAVLGFGVSLTPLVAHFWSLFVVANVVAVVWSVALFLWGRRQGPVLASREGLEDAAPAVEVDASGAAAARAQVAVPRVVRELWFGNELNPVWLGVDLKMFMYHPSLLGVYLLILGFASAQWDLHGLVTPQMMMLVAFWNLYLWTHYIKEEFMLSTWDVIAENFGFMLVWGDLVLVPFLYCIPGWWVVDDTTPWPPAGWIALSAFFVLALTVFRGANWQKERYKQERTSARIWGRPVETIGGRLLVSGWWGIGRKINYTGEIGVYLAFAMTAGFDHLAPYALPLWLLALLVHRAARDDSRCRAKYGALWEQYCQRVPFRMVPFLY
ncbi:MAG: hypothetical protein ACFCGT_05065 [Sandaracinaceae bacterium]